MENNSNKNIRSITPEVKIDIDSLCDESVKNYTKSDLRKNQVPITQQAEKMILTITG